MIAIEATYDECKRHIDNICIKQSLTLKHGGSEKVLISEAPLYTNCLSAVYFATRAKLVMSRQVSITPHVKRDSRHFVQIFIPRLLVTAVVAAVFYGASPRMSK